jgi:hypothetical protein
MSADLSARVDSLEQAVKRQFRYTAILIIVMLVVLAALGFLSVKFSAYAKDHPVPAKSA